MTQLSALIAPEEAPAADADGEVLLIADNGDVAASAPVGLKTRACGWEVDLTIDREVTLTAVGHMRAVEVRGAGGQRYIRISVDLHLNSGDLVTVLPDW